MADGTSVGSIYYDLDLDSKKFEQNLAAADAKAKGFASQLGNQFEKSTQSSQAFAGGLLAVSAGVLAAGGAALKSAGDYQQNAVAFEVMLGSASKAQSLLKQISDFAASTPFELPAVVEGSKKLLAFGVAGDQVIDTFRMLGNIAAAVGTDKLPGLINVFGQVKAAGRLMSQDLLQFTSAGVPIIDMLAQHFGIAKEKIKDMVENGKVSFNDLQASLALLGGPSGKWADLMDRQSKTLQGTLSNVSDSLGRVARAVVGMDAQGNIKEGSIFAQATDAINKLLGFLTAHQDQIVDFFNKSFGFIVKYGPEIAGILLGALAPGVIALTAALISGAIALGPWLLAGLAIGFLFQHHKQIIAWLTQAWQAVSGFFINLWRDITKAFTKAGKDIDGAINGVVRWVQGIPARLGAVWNATLTGIGHFIGATGNFFAHLPFMIAEALGWVVGRFIRFIIVDVPNFVMGTIAFIAMLPGAILGVMVAVYNAISTWFVNSYNTAVNWTAGAVTAVGAWFASLPGVVWNAVVSAYNAITHWFGNMYNASRSAGSSIVNGFGSFINGLPGMVGGIFDSVVRTIMGFGQKLWDMARQVAGSFWQGFKKGLGISSPSYVERAFMAIGKQSTMTLDQMKGDISSLQSIGNNLMTMPKSLAQANGGQIPVWASSSSASAASAPSGDIYHINLTGVLADSPAAKRQLGLDLIRSVDDARRAQGKPQILGAL